MKKQLDKLRYLLLLSSTLFILSCSSDKPTIIFPTVNIDSVTTKQIEIYGYYVGKAEASQSVQIRARVDGFLEDKKFTEGTLVNKGALLYTIDPSIYKALLSHSEAKLVLAIAESDKAKRDVNRMQPLFDQNAASQLDLDNAISSKEYADAKVLMAKAELEQAKLDMSYTRLYSPISGYISATYIDRGTLVGSGTNSLLSEVYKTDPIHINFNVSTRDFLKSKKENKEIGRTEITDDWRPTITITLPDETDYQYKGAVNYIAPTLNASTGTFMVQGVFPNPNRDFKPGQLTKVQLLLNIIEDAVVVPRKSLVFEKGGAFIYVVHKDSVAEKRMVQIERQLGNEIIIKKALEKGEYVVVEGMHKLENKIKVNPVFVDKKETNIDN